MKHFRHFRDLFKHYESVFERLKIEFSEREKSIRTDQDVEKRNAPQAESALCL